MNGPKNTLEFRFKAVGELLLALALLALSDDAADEYFELGEGGVPGGGEVVGELDDLGFVSVREVRNPIYLVCVARENLTPL